MSASHISAAAAAETPDVHEEHDFPESEGSVVSMDHDDDDGEDEEEDGFPFVDPLTRILVTEEGEPLVDIMADIRDSLAKLVKVLYASHKKETK